MSKNHLIASGEIKKNLRRVAPWLAAALIGLSVNACSSGSDPVATEDTGIQLASGFSATIFADSVGRARHMAVNDNGDLYVAIRSRSASHGIVALRDSNGDGKAEVIEQFGRHPGNGIGIHNGYLYFAPDSAVLRYRLTPGELVPQRDHETVVTGFPEQRTHSAKSIDFDDDGNLYVNIGAPSNACQEKARSPGSPGLDPCPQLERQAGIWRFKADQLDQTQERDGSRFATGIRNAVAIEWNTDAQKLYLMQHGRDQLGSLWPDFYDDEANAELPSEELLAAVEGSDFGWPYCYNDHLQGEKVLAPEYGGDGKTVGRCDEFADPVLAFPGHWAPNDLLYYTGDQFPEAYRNGYFIAFHGSWNRAPLKQGGYKVVFVPFDGETPSGEWEVFADGFSGTEALENPRNARFRPVGLAQARDGSIFVSDSVTGRIWKISYTGS